MNIYPVIIGALVGYIVFLHMRVASLQDGIREINKEILEALKLAEALKEKFFQEESKSCKNS